VVFEVAVDVRVVFEVDVEFNVNFNVDFKVVLEVNVDVIVDFEVKTVLEIHFIQVLLLAQGVEVLCEGFVLVVVLHEVVVLLCGGGRGCGRVELEVQGVEVLGGGGGL
jgi:hypothetical protein